MTEPNLLPKFFELLDEANYASRAVDDFDLYSENPESKKQWDSLLKKQDNALKELISYVLENPLLLAQVQSLTK